MRHNLEDLAIDKRGKFYYVVDKRTGEIQSIKYEDEAHAMRYAKHISNYRRDWHFMEIEKRIDGKTVKSEIVTESQQIPESDPEPPEPLTAPPKIEKAATPRTVKEKPKSEKKKSGR